MVAPTKEQIKEYIEAKAEGKLGHFEAALADEIQDDDELNELMDELKAVELVNFGKNF